MFGCISFYQLYPPNILLSSQEWYRGGCVFLHHMPLFIRLLQFIRPDTKSLLIEILFLPYEILFIP